MKKFFLISISIACINAIFAQIDSGKIYNSKKLIKGFYRNYNDYINNSPFIITDFFIIPYHLSKIDTTTILAAEYKFGKSKTQIPDYWGFCDGNSVYIHYPNLSQNTFSYKLEYLGPYPYFTYAERKDLVSMSLSNLTYLTSVKPFNLLGLGLSILSFTQPAFYNLFVVNPSEKIKSAFNRNYMKNLLSSQQDILNAYQKEKDSLTNNKLKEFLIEYNERVK